MQVSCPVADAVHKIKCSSSLRCEGDVKAGPGLPTLRYS